MFDPSVDVEDALAGTVATWLERKIDHLVTPAPPMLRTHPGGRSEDRVVDFGLPWTLPAETVRA
jgi:hypothetical protein